MTTSSTSGVPEPASASGPEGRVGAAPDPAVEDRSAIRGPDTTGDAGLAPKRTRASSTYAAVAVGLVILVLVIIFIAQNTGDALVHFFTLKFHLALGLLVLAAAVAGGLIVLMVSLARVLQLRLAARRHRQEHEG